MDAKKILYATEHRPYPLPAGPWIMQQEWHNLLFAHYPIAPALLRPLIPPQLTLDTYDATCWVGIVPFLMRNVYPRGLFAVPGLSQFPELNVRTYVTVNGIPGVYFFSLEAGNALAVSLARNLFYLPYFHAAMEIRPVTDGFLYRSRRIHRGAPNAAFSALYRPTATVALSEPGSLEYWFTERYCLYAVHRNQAYRGNIHHVRWPLQVAKWDLSYNTMAQSHHIPLSEDTQPLLHFARLQEVLVWPLQRV